MREISSFFTLYKFIVCFFSTKVKGYLISWIWSWSPKISHLHHHPPPYFSLVQTLKACTVQDSGQNSWTEPDSSPSCSSTCQTQKYDPWMSFSTSISSTTLLPKQGKFQVFRGNLLDPGLTNCCLGQEQTGQHLKTPSAQWMVRVIF